MQIGQFTFKLCISIVIPEAHVVRGSGRSSRKLCKVLEYLSLTVNICLFQTDVFTAARHCIQNSVFFFVAILSGLHVYWFLLRKRVSEKEHFGVYSSIDPKIQTALYLIKWLSRLIYIIRAKCCRYETKCALF